MTDPLSTLAVFGALAIAAVVIGALIAALPGVEAWLYRALYGRD